MYVVHDLGPLEAPCMSLAMSCDSREVLVSTKNGKLWRLLTSDLTTTLHASSHVVRGVFGNFWKFWDCFAIVFGSPVFLFLMYYWTTENSPTSTQNHPKKQKNSPSQPSPNVLLAHPTLKYSVPSPIPVNSSSGTSPIIPIYSQRG